MAYKVNLHDPDGCCVDHSDCGDGSVLGSEKNDDRQMTSAINNMSVADVRKALSNMRKEWTKHSVVHPFFPSYYVTEELTISEFAFKFVMGHHAKRHAKFSLNDN